MTRQSLTCSTVLLALAVSGCSNTVSMGTLTDTDQEFSFSRHDGLCFDSVSVTLPDGETFIGFLNASLSSDKRCTTPGYPVSKDTLDVLFGDRVNMMACQFSNESSDSSRRCELSDGRTITLN